MVYFSSKVILRKGSLLFSCAWRMGLQVDGSVVIGSTVNPVKKTAMFISANLGPGVV